MKCFKMNFEGLKFLCKVFMNGEKFLSYLKKISVMKWKKHYEKSIGKKTNYHYIRVKSLWSAYHESLE